MNGIRVLVADDHTMVRTGLVKILEDSGECEVVGERATAWRPSSGPWPRGPTWSCWT
jgi:DNA-binding NarL/FixJ family response regulator